MKDIATSVAFAVVHEHGRAHGLGAANSTNVRPVYLSMKISRLRRISLIWIPLALPTTVMHPLLTAVASVLIYIIYKISRLRRVSLIHLILALLATTAPPPAALVSVPLCKLKDIVTSDGFVFLNSTGTASYNYASYGASRGGAVRPV